MILFLTETTLFYHHLRTTGTRAPPVAYPTTKSNSGIIANWADHVADAARSTPTLSSYNPSRAGLDPVASGSRHTTREQENKILASLAQIKHVHFIHLLVILILADMVTATGSPET
jgi:hypothetical protein